MIIIVSGFKQSGKNTVTDYLVTKYNFDDYAFASSIKAICQIAFGWSESFFESTKKKETIDPVWGISPRQAMQWIGTEVFQFEICKAFPCFEEKTGRHIWVDRFVNFFKNGYFSNSSHNVAISDNRFPHEISVIQEKLNYVPILLVKVVRGTKTNTDMHYSEIEIDKLPYDVLIENNGTIDELYKQIETRIGPYLNGGQ